MKQFAALCVFLLTAACSSRFLPPAVSDLSAIEKTRTTDIERLLSEAADLAAKGDYVSLKQAYTIYQNLSSTLPYRMEHREKQWRTALLLILKEKELAVYGTANMKQVNQLVRSAIFPEEYRILTRFVEWIPFATKGIAQQEIMNSEALRQRTEWICTHRPILDFLRIRAPGDEFFAYLYLSIAASFSDGEETVRDARRIAETFSTSPLLRFRLAVGPQPDVPALEKLVEDNPGFGEAFYFLGDAAMGRQEIVSAETNYQKAFSRIPESVNITLSLGNIEYWFEELRQAIDFYQKTLDLLPEHHDALLGKAVCLGYLGRHKEAIEVLRTILLFGHARTGEAYYWIAWNQNMLGLYDTAREWD